MEYSTHNWVQGMIATNGQEYAMKQLIERCDAEDKMYESRFFHKLPLLNDQQEITGYRLVKRNEQQVSSMYDMSDCNDEHLEFFYDEDGVLYPVTISKMERCEMGEDQIVYGHSDMIANGKVVGTVTYTDH